MHEVVLKATTAENGAIHIASTGLKPGIEVEVRIQPVEAIERYDLKPYRPIKLPRHLVTEDNPVEAQRRMRAEWDR